MHKFKTVASGGTFDVFHKGHQEFIKFQLDIADKIIIGITSDNYFTNSPKSHQIQSFTIRRASLLSFLKSLNAEERVKIIKLQTPEPNDLNAFNVEAIVVTQDTKKGAELINSKRVKVGLPKLPIIVSPLIADFEGKTISSTRIRNCEIDTNGDAFIDNNWTLSTLYLPKKVRKSLREPFGRLIKNNRYNFKKLVSSTTISVGDISTKTLLSKGIKPKISVVDLIVEREKKFTNVFDIGFADSHALTRLKNEPGTISQELWSEIKNSLTSKSSTILLISGEEDLAVLPMILLAPIGWKIFYGQPGEGMVEVVLDWEVKSKAKKILQLFTHSL